MLAHCGILDIWANDEEGTEEATEVAQGFAQRGAQRVAFHSSALGHRGNHSIPLSFHWGEERNKAKENITCSDCPPTFCTPNSLTISHAEKHWERSQFFIRGNPINQNSWTTTKITSILRHWGLLHGVCFLSMNYLVLSGSGRFSKAYPIGQTSSRDSHKIFIQDQGGF